MSGPLFIERHRRRTPLKLGALLGEGAAGKVYGVVGAPELAVKLYHDAASAATHEAKITLMLANVPSLPALRQDGLDYPQVAWPEARVIDKDGRFLGFVMPAIDLARSTSLVNLLQKSSRRIENISDYYGYRVLVAYNMASMFAELHRVGHHMIDMKPANLRVYPATGWIAVVDTDGFSIAAGRERISAGQLSDDYIAPESWQRAPAELGEAQDGFALAVIIFQLLNNGVHPFAGMPVDGAVHPTDIQTRILRDLYAYGLDGHDAVRPSLVSVHKTFRRDTRMLFDRAFMPGHRRPSAEQWRGHLAGLLDLLTPCKANPTEHAHFGGGCGFCLYESRIAAAAKNARPRPVPQRAPEIMRPVGPPRMISSRGGAMRLGGRRGKSRKPSAKPSLKSAQPVARKKAATNRRRKASRAGIGTILGLAVALPLGTALWPLIDQMILQNAVAGSSATVPAVPVSQPPPLLPYMEPLDYAVSTKSAASIRLGPGSEFDVVDTIASNEKVLGFGETRLEDGTIWIWIRRSGGSSGFVTSSVLHRVYPLAFTPDPQASATDPLPSGNDDRRPITAAETGKTIDGTAPPTMREIDAVHSETDDAAFLPETVERDSTAH